MATQGEVLINPNGSRLTFRRTARDSAGAALEVEVTYPPHSNKPPTHYHPHQSETFTVLRGALTTRVGGADRVYAAGETFVIPPGVPHMMLNAGDDPVQFTWVTEPALATERFFEAMWTLAARGQDDLLHMAPVLAAHTREFRLAGLPYPLQRALFAGLAFISRVLGYQRLSGDLRSL
jgi:quercetin dioxygenase-like cupin family protein